MVRRTDAGVLLAVYFFGTGGAAPLAKTIAGDLAKARRLLDAASEKAELRYQQDQERIEPNSEATVNDLNQEWRRRRKGAIDHCAARSPMDD